MEGANPFAPNDDGKESAFLLLLHYGSSTKDETLGERASRSRACGCGRGLYATETVSLPAPIVQLKAARGTVPNTDDKRCRR